MEEIKPEARPPLDRLEEIGFNRVGQWTMSNGALKFFTGEDVAEGNVLYAFVSDREVLYVGKSVGPIVTRFYGYRNPGRTQFTNIYCNEAICKLIAEKKQVEVFVRYDSRTSKIGSFVINESAGLEDAIIHDLAPPWNRLGQRRRKVKDNQ